MKAVLKNKLKIYSSLAVMPVAGIVNAQIVHTPINYTGGCEQYDIDLNSDGFVDISFIGSSCSSYTVVNGANEYFTKMRWLWLVSPYTEGLIGSGFAPALSAGSLIEPSMPWGGPADLHDYYLLKNKIATYYSNDFYYSTFLIKDHGNFKSSEGKFTPFRFETLAGDYHYGWLRLKDVTNIYNPTTEIMEPKWTLVDMAYESTPNTPILVGAMFLAPPPATNPTAMVSGGSINLTFDASTGEEAISEYRLFVVKEGTAFDLTEAEANNNYETINPDGSSDYAHAFIAGTIDSDGNNVLRTTPTLDASGEALAANQNYNIYVLNMAKTPYATENSLSAPSNTFAVSSNLSTQNVDWQNEVFVYPVPNNGTFKIKLQSANSIEEIKLLDVTGKLVEDLSSKQNETLLEVTNLMRGSYVLHVKSATSSKAYKIIVM